MDTEIEAKVILATLRDMGYELESPQERRRHTLCMMAATIYASPDCSLYTAAVGDAINIMDYLAEVERLEGEDAP